MHVLTVLSHPVASSFSHAVAERFHDGVTQSGHSWELADLHAEGFDPRWTAEDFAQFEAREMPADVRAEQRRIERCDALCLVFPLYWYSMPAMLKGWLDRVWSYGWAYDQVGQHDQSLQKPRTGVMLIPAGANPANWQPHGIQEAMETLWLTGSLGYLGITDKRLHFLNGSTGSAPRREGLLQRAFEAGRDLAVPQQDTGKT